MFLTTVQLPVLNRWDLEKFHGTPQGSRIQSASGRKRSAVPSISSGSPEPQRPAKLLQQQVARMSVSDMRGSAIKLPDVAPLFRAPACYTSAVIGEPTCRRKTQPDVRLRDAIQTLFFGMNCTAPRRSQSRWNRCLMKQPGSQGGIAQRTPPASLRARRNAIAPDGPARLIQINAGFSRALLVPWAIDPDKVP